jgi:chromosomal replication initiator protein
MSKLLDSNEFIAAIEDLKAKLKDSINTSVYNKIVKNIKFHSFSNNTLYILSDCNLSKTLLKSDYSDQVKKILSDKLGQDINVDFITGSDVLNLETSPKIVPNNVLSEGINNKLTFEKFIIKDYNKLPYAALSMVVEGNFKFNPIFIYGGVGVGKTHLLQAFGNKYMEVNKNKSLLYMETTDFIRKAYTATMKNKEGDGALEKFKRDFSKYDVLIFDDIQFFANKEKISEYFFSIFTDAINDNKQIILSSDKSLSELSFFEERISSRISSGVTFNIVKPDYPTVRTILSNKIKDNDYGFNFTDESLEYIANRVNSDIRKLEGIINTVNFHAINTLSPGEIITLNKVKEILGSDSNIISEHNYDIDPNIFIEKICSA